MNPLFVIIVWSVFAAGNVALAEWNDSVRKKRIEDKNPKQIEHFWYGLGYAALCCIIFLISHNWLELFSLLLLHLSVFPVAYNKFSDLPAFHLSTTSKALTDRLMVRLGLKSTEEVNIIAFAISFILMILQIFIK